MSILQVTSRHHNRISYMLCKTINKMYQFKILNILTADPALSYLNPLHILLFKAIKHLAFTYYNIFSQFSFNKKVRLLSFEFLFKFESVHYFRC